MADEIAYELPEGAEAAPADLQDEVTRRQKSATAAILDKAAADPVWKQKFLDDPDAAIEELGVAGDLDPGSLTPEVIGQWHYNTKWVHYCWYGGWRKRGRKPITPPPFVRDKCN